MAQLFAAIEMEITEQKLHHLRRLSNISSVIWSSFVKMLVIKSQIALIRSLPVIRNLHHQCRHQA